MSETLALYFVVWVCCHCRSVYGTFCRQ